MNVANLSNFVSIKNKKLIDSKYGFLPTSY